MPKRRKAARPDALAYVFARGFVATALLTAVQDRSTATPRRVLHRAIQGGAALAAGTAAADALAQRRYGIALAAATVGAAAVLAAENLLDHPTNPPASDPLADPHPPNDDKETGLGQEIAQEG
ncbi:hypothetical protein [Azospirillum doebereinerae]|uniref:hypothetical protein n=1 Tax=Azospirillum doebereinerae TaxID=92933 RepID=UPI00163C4C34|nr:hypothetical protein [Azospirillum doebereinerae]